MLLIVVKCPFAVQLVTECGKTIRALEHLCKMLGMRRVSILLLLSR